MSEPRVDPWKKWDKVKSLGRGGQGHALLVKPKGAADTEARFVLKELIKKHDPERRRRMSREVAALRSLSHPGIPKVVDSNAEHFEDQVQELYIVSEYIPGPTLE